MSSQHLIWCNVQDAAYTIKNKETLNGVEVIFLEPTFNISKPKMQFSKEFFQKIVNSNSLQKISFNDALIKAKNLALLKR